MSIVTDLAWHLEPNRVCTLPVVACALWELQLTAGRALAGSCAQLGLCMTGGTAAPNRSCGPPPPLSTREHPGRRFLASWAKPRVLGAGHVVVVVQGLEATAGQTPGSGRAGREDGGR